MSTPLTAGEKANIAFKQLLGVPSTSDAREYYEEPLIFARGAVLLDQIWGQTVPGTAPPGLVALGDNDLDDNGYKMAGSLVGKTDGNITRYIKVNLEAVVTGEGLAYRAPLSSVSHPDGDSGGIPTTGTSGTFNRVTADIIPYNYDSVFGTYVPKIYRSTGTEISTGAGQWAVNIETGIVTFYRYDDVSGYVGPNDPPLLSYYRYTGTKGVSIETGVIFDLGDESTTGDDLAGIYISSTTVTSLDDSQFTGSLNLGSGDGSYRLTVQGANGDQTKSRLHIQKRLSGTWYTHRRFN